MCITTVGLVLVLVAVSTVVVSPHDIAADLVDVQAPSAEDYFLPFNGQDQNFEIATKKAVKRNPASTCRPSYWEPSHWSYVVINGARCHLHTPMGNVVRDCKGGCRSWEYNMYTQSNTLGSAYRSDASRCYCCKYKYQSITVSACCKRANSNGTASDVELVTSVHVPTSCSCQMCHSEPAGLPTTTQPTTTTAATMNTTTGLPTTTLPTTTTAAAMNTTTVTADIDECLNSSSACHADAECTNTIGSYTCKCKNGYLGDGNTCTSFCKHTGLCNKDQCTDMNSTSANNCTAAITSTWEITGQINLVDVDILCLGNETCISVKPGGNLTITNSVYVYSSLPINSQPSQQSNNTGNTTQNRKKRETMDTKSNLDSNTNLDNTGTFIHLDAGTSLFLNQFTGTHQQGNRMVNGDGSNKVNIMDSKFTAGGIALYNNGKLTISDSTMTQCHSSENGGGIYLSGSQATLKYSSFLGNSAGVDAGSGGGLYLLHSDAVVENCKFSQNKAGMYAGAISISSSTIRVTGSRFVGNMEKSDSGCIDMDDSTAHITSCVFEDNINGSLSAHRSTLDVISSSFTNNSAGSGAAMDIWDSNVEVKDCYFQGNKAKYYSGGAVFLSSSHIDLSDSTFQANTAFATAGAIYAYNSSLNIGNTTFTDNNSGAAAGALDVDSSTGNLVGSKFDSNTCTNNDSLGGAIRLLRGSTVNITMSDFFGNIASMGGGLALRGASAFVTVCNFTGDETFGIGGGAIDLRTTLHDHKDDTEFTLDYTNTSSYLYVTGCDFNVNAHGSGPGGADVFCLGTADVFSTLIASSNIPDVYKKDCNYNQV